MKKFIAFILAAGLLLSLMVGCGKKEASESEEAPVTEETISQDVEVPEAPADEVEEEPATEDSPAVEEKPVQEEKPVAEEKPAAPEVPKEEVPAPQEPIPAPEQPKEEPAPQIPSETPILPPSSSNTTEDIPDETDAGNQMESIVQSNTGLEGSDVKLFHLEMWAYVHGIATMIATGFFELDWDLISRMLTDSYQGLIKQYKKE